MKVLKSLSTVGYALLSGMIIWQIGTYGLYRWKHIYAVSELGLQNGTLITMMFLYAIFCALVLCVKTKFVFYLSCLFLLIAGVVAGAFYADFYAEVEPFEIIYLAKDVSMLLLAMCICHMTSFAIK